MKISARRWLLPAAIAAALVLLVAYASTRPLDVEIAAIARGPVREYVEEEGRTRVRERYVISTPVEGRLLRVEREEGDEVAAGELLAEVDPLSVEARVKSAEAQLAGVRAQLVGVDRRRPSEDELARARLQRDAATEAAAAAAADLSSAQAALEQARRDAERARELEAQGDLSPADREAADLAATQAAEEHAARERLHRVRRLEARIADLSATILEDSARDLDWEEDLQRARIAEIEADLAVVRDDRRRARLLAPVGGVVLRRHQESEALLAAGTPVLEIGDLMDLEVAAEMLSEDAARMRRGMQAEVFGRALGDRVLPATVERVYPGAFTKVSSLGVEQQRTWVVLKLEDPPEGLRLGDEFRVEVRVVFDERGDALLVPESALFRANGEWRVFRVEGGRARETTVGTGLRDGRVREVLSGLESGDRVVLHPGPDLADGARVR